MIASLFSLEVEAAASQTSDGRTAALVLHALSPTDRAWLMQRLPLPARDVVSVWIEELEALGLPGDVALVRRAVAPAGSSEGTSDATTSSLAAEASAGRTIEPEPLDSATLVRYTAKEPAALVAEVLSLDGSTWPAGMLAEMPPSRRRDVEVALAIRAQAMLDPPGSTTTQGPGSRRRAQLMKLLENRIAQWHRTDGDSIMSTERSDPAIPPVPTDPAYRPASAGRSARAWFGRFTRDRR